MSRKRSHVGGGGREANFKIKFMNDFYVADDAKFMGTTIKGLQ